MGGFGLSIVRNRDLAGEPRIPEPDSSPCLPELGIESVSAGTESPKVEDYVEQPSVIT